LSCSDVGALRQRLGNLKKYFNSKMRKAGFLCSALISCFLLTNPAASAPAGRERRQTDCPVFQCKLKCPVGFEVDDGGCNLCQCQTCPPVMCPMECLSLTKRQVNGCGVCGCDPRPICPNIECDLACEFYKQDELGCDLCECVEEGSPL